MRRYGRRWPRGCPQTSVPLISQARPRNRQCPDPLRERVYSSRFELLDFRFQFAHTPLQLGSSIQRGRILEPLLVLYAWRTRVVFVSGEIVRYPALSREQRAVTDANVSSRADLPRKNAIVADLRGSRKPDLAAKQSVCADPRAMADKNKVVYLGSAADASLADGSAVKARISLYLDVILDHHTTRLQNFAPAAVLLFCKSEAICSDYYTVL